MSKETKKPYRVEQAVLDLADSKLETVSEKELRETIEKLKETYSKKRKDRIVEQKSFFIVYYNTRDYTTKLKESVEKGEVSPKQAIKMLVDFVNSEEVSLEKESE